MVKVTKRFTYSKDKGFVLENMTEVNKFIKDNIHFLKNYNHYTNRNYNLELFEEILDMIQHDQATAKIDFSAIRNLVGVDRLKQNRTQIICLFNIVFILGTIYYNVIDYGKNGLKGIDNGQINPSRNTNMILEGYKDFLFSKENQTSSYGSTLIFMTLLERDMRYQIKKRYTRSCLRNLERKMIQGKLKLDKKDDDLFIYLRNHFGLDGQRAKKNYDKQSATTELSYLLFRKYKIINPNNEFFKSLFNYKFNYITLNQLIRSEEFKSQVDDRFWNIVNYMFSPKYLNLRNQLTHGNTGYMNYYHPGVTSLLYKLYLMVNDGAFLK